MGGVASLGELDGEVDHGPLPGREDLRVDGGAASEDVGGGLALASSALPPERGPQPGGVVHRSVAALVLRRDGHGDHLPLHPAQRGGIAPHGAEEAVVAMTLAI